MKMMKKQMMLLLMVVTTSGSVQSQSISATLTAHAGQQIRLTGFNYDERLELATTVADSTGNFVLEYPKD